MAEYDARTKGAGLDPTDLEAYGKDCKVAVKLGKSQFKAVAKTVRLFDDYLCVPQLAEKERDRLTLL